MKTLKTELQAGYQILRGHISPEHSIGIVPELWRFHNRPLCHLMTRLWQS